MERWQVEKVIDKLNTLSETGIFNSDENCLLLIAPVRDEVVAMLTQLADLAGIE